MTTYRIEMMDSNNYGKYMGGSNEYNVEYTEIEAESRAEAIAIATEKNPGMILNTNYVRSLEELEAEQAEREAYHREAEEKREQERIKREQAKQRKIEKDLANGITPEMRKAMTNSKRYEREIEKLKKELAELEAKKAYWDAKI